MSTATPRIRGLPPVVPSTGIAAILLGLSLTAPLVTSPAAAQSLNCAPREQIIERLAVQYGEEPIGVAVTATGDLLELLASPQGSWSIIITKAGGPSCLMSTGDGWRGAPTQVAEDPEI